MEQIKQMMIDVKNTSSTAAQYQQGIQRMMEITGRENWERAAAQLKRVLPAQGTSLADTAQIERLQIKQQTEFELLFM